MPLFGQVDGGIWLEFETTGKSSAEDNTRTMEIVKYLKPGSKTVPLAGTFQVDYGSEDKVVIIGKENFMSRHFDEIFFKKNLRTSWMGSEFIYLKKTDSTNTYLKNIPASDLVHGTVLLTDDQSAGRGQHQKKWIADPGLNLTFTIAFKPASAERLTLLTLACTYAIAETLKEYTSQPVHLKWPNDIYIGNRKVAGILTECSFMGSRPERVLIGVGLNVNQEKFSHELEQVAVSLVQVAEKPVSREKVLADCLQSIERIYQLWHKQSSELHKMISRNMIGYGEWVKLNIDGKVSDEQYKFLGVNEKGELLVLNEQLEIHTYSHEQIRIIPGNESISKTI